MGVVGELMVEKEHASENTKSNWAKGKRAGDVTALAYVGGEETEVFEEANG